MPVKSLKRPTTGSSPYIIKPLPQCIVLDHCLFVTPRPEIIMCLNSLQLTVTISMATSTMFHPLIKDTVLRLFIIFLSSCSLEGQEETFRLQRSTAHVAAKTYSMYVPCLRSYGVCIGFNSV